MTVKVRKYKRGGWEVDIRFDKPDGEKVRVRKRAPVSSKSGSRRWGEALERELLFSDTTTPEEKKEVPTLEEFKPRYIEGYAKANRQKPSGVDSKESLLRNHLIPAMGDLELDEIVDERVQQLKYRMKGKHPKTVNNALTTLNTLLKVAVRWKVIDKMPCTIELLKVPLADFKFYDFDEYAWLVDGAGRNDHESLVMVLLGGDAGLRLGEIIAFEWDDVDFRRGSIHVQRSEWQGKVGVPKGGRTRRVPMTTQLRDALKRHRHLRGPRVLYRDDGLTVTPQNLKTWMKRATRRAGLPECGRLHSLRHTFCSHLAMRGAPAKAIQELAGHKDLTTTQRYMHLSPAALESAIRLLDEGRNEAVFGDIVETGNSKIVSS